MYLLYLDVAQALILVLGGITVFYATRAYRRTKSQAMFLLGVGFGFVTAGAVAAGLTYNLVGGLEAAVTLQAFSQAVGFFIIVYSLARAKG